jgi:hypothetical protein
MKLKSLPATTCAFPRQPMQPPIEYALPLKSVLGKTGSGFCGTLAL